MNINDIIHWISSIIRQHEAWSLPVIFFLAAGESLVFLSLLLPATLILLAIGVLIGENDINFWPVWIVTTAGAFLGDWISYWIGHHYQYRIFSIWPLSRNAQLLEYGHAFFKKWGILSIFIGRFFGPLRAIVPLICGICGMPHGYFQLANITSAMLWAFSVLAPGALGIKWLSELLK
ncbi:hypothetical protein, DedA family [Serratia symbiotica str. 'Cinara cedri']|nr:hypothetical protein, DedA family [Serratia symbiotica str. 'Cinara cedri']